MKVSNLAIAALFESLSRNNIAPQLLLQNTQLTYDYVLEHKKMHSWAEFVQMYDNIAMLLGRDKAAREIAYLGLYNSNTQITKMRIVGTGLIDVKLLYWYLGTLACRHLFKNTVRFKYKKIDALNVQMEVKIPDELEHCPLLLETYTYLWENVPTLMGLPKARVQTEISGRRAVYSVNFVKSSYFHYLWSKFRKGMTGYVHALELMDEFETQSLKMSKLADEKSELLRIMSHDISNISLIVDMSLAKVLKNENLSEDGTATVQKAINASNRLRNILRDVQKLEVANLREVTIEPVDIEAVFTTIQDYFNEQLIQKNLHLVNRIELPLGVMAMAEKESLESNVLLNLISNAIKFSHHGSQINMEAYLDNNKFIIAISDFGVGINPEDMNGFFNKHIRKSTIGTNGEVGTGLGLGIVRTYVQLYGGTITVEPNYPSGTIFKISLSFSMPQFMDRIHLGALAPRISGPSSTIRN